MPFEPDQLLLSRYCDARDDGELELARALWEQLAVNNFDRVNQIVKAFRFSAGGPGLPDHEWGSAASEAYMRVISMGAAFRHREIGRFYAALVTCVQNSCKDFGRKELRHDMRAAGSIDSTFDPDGEAGPYDAALAAHDQRLREQAGDALDAEHSRVEAEQLVAWGISQIANDNYREVLEMTWIHKLPADEIADQLGISMENVYARRVAAPKNWRRSSVTLDRDRILSEFIDAWNAGSRPDVDDYLARAPVEQQGELADQLLSFLTFAPTPSYDDSTLAAIRAEPIVTAALTAAEQRGGLLPSLLTSLRERLSMTTPQLASELVTALDLPSDRQSKTASYLERLERGELEPARVSRRVFDALAQVFEIPRSQLEGAGDLSRWLPAPAPAAAPVFRADKDAARAVGAHLDVLADALQASGGEGRDEVDDLFLGGR